MNEIQRLIHEMCPNGVPMVALGEVFDQKNGYTPSKNEASFWENGNLPWFRMEDIRENGRILNDSILHITPEGLKKSGLFPANSIIVATSATIGEHALITVDFLCNQRFTCLTPKSQYKDRVDMKFYFYIMFEVDEWCKSHVNQGGFASVDMSGFSTIQIPLPPLPIQRRIVEILDKFTSLVSSLDSEIALRQKQYEYYRNKLLSFDEGFATIKLKDITSKIASGATPSGGDRAYKETGISLIRSQNVLDHSFSKEGIVFIDKEQADKLSNVEIKEGDLLINITGDSVARACKVPSDIIPSRTNQHVAIIRINSDEIDTDFLLYELNTRKNELIQIATANGGSRKALSKGILEKLDIFFPPKSVQLSIVRTLDLFESLLSNLKKERELRQKQYEYYREKLLTFA